ncbi:MAG: molybdopterin-dependent oxidoreductase, partial [Ornithinibacter sp.]
MTEDNSRGARMLEPWRGAPADDVDPLAVDRHHRRRSAAGVEAVAVAANRVSGQMGPLRAVSTLRHLNQAHGFDCMGCAWPDPDPEHRSFAEFCENGAKAVAEEATRRRADRAFFAAHRVDELAGWSDFQLGQQGRITEPMVLREGGSHYEPISWDDAIAVVATALRGLDEPGEAAFYTSGRASNEAAFTLQLFARAFGTNNLPDCSNMCHESTSVALAESIGIGKGSVSLQDIHDARLIVIAGQNPGTNHPRMLSALEKAKANGATIIAVNPLPEAGLTRFKNPQTPKGMLLGGTKLADRYVQIRLGGDQALFQAIGKHLLEADGSTGSGTGDSVLDRPFIEEFTDGFEEYADAMRAVPWRELVAATGVPEKTLRAVGESVRRSKATI